MTDAFATAQTALINLTPEERRALQEWADMRWPQHDHRDLVTRTREFLRTAPEPVSQSTLATALGVSWGEANALLQAYAHRLGPASYVFRDKEVG